MTHRPDRLISNHYRQQFHGAEPVRLRDPVPQRPRSHPPRRQRGRQPGKFILAGGSMLALAAVLVNPGAKAPPTDGDVCQQQIESRTVLSRDQLSELLAAPESSSKSQIRKIVNDPYCILSPANVQAGVEADREAYPLAFDPQTWLIVLYQNDEYAGYDFKFQH